MRVPAYLLRHRIVVEPYLGDSANGPVYGPPREIRCHLMPTRRTVRGTNGRTIGDSTTAVCQLDAGDVVTPEARVTVAGRVVEVVSVGREEFPRGPTPNHLAVAFV